MTAFGTLSALYRNFIVKAKHLSFGAPRRVDGRCLLLRNLSIAPEDSGISCQ